ncbi:hypothetical protein [Frondihabitans australicus]|uniref:hypothetical protein n=1 Tax=Frondihabitans australicus TaxID=386892 RepID=UPI0011C4712E|nr:hypothetical protein [Frondihabitans australicus]
MLVSMSGSGTAAAAAPAASAVTTRAVSALSQAGVNLGSVAGVTTRDGRSETTGAQITSGGALAAPPASGGSREASLGVQPEAVRNESRIVSGSLAIFDRHDSAVAMSAENRAGYSILYDSGAPTDYRYDVTLDGRPAHLTLAAGGAVAISNSDGIVVDVFQPPWARDAHGVEVATRYRIDGGTLVQEVDHAGATYPVVADPRLACDLVFCTLELTRAETKKLANNALGVNGVCAIMGPVAPVCAVVVTGMWVQAKIAVGRGQCVGVRGVRAPVITGIHAVYTTCYA